jgi:Arc/MetJ-type ribon-helix-helix transcriptional regulator
MSRPMIRTQIFLTDKQRSEIAVIAEAQGKKQSEIIREAIDRLIDQTAQNRKIAALREAAGIWKNRDDLPDFRAIRSEWDR